LFEQNLLLLEELVAITVRLNPSQNLKDVPIKRFYRYVIQKDHDRRTAVATFKKLPEDTLLSLDMDVPNAWLAMPVSSVHDLDNIKLADLAPAERTKGIDSLFELTKVLVEGHCIDSKSKQPPRGLQMVLGSSSYPDMVDTIVMANLGYFQLKAGPGVWQMRLRSGRSSRLYDLDVVTEDALEFSKSSGGTPFPVASVSVRSFEGLTLFVKVSKKPGKEGINLLEEDGTATHDDELDKDGEGMWASIKKG
jgi:UDP-glucose:glycoprotein glucosyltransferase